MERLTIFLIIPLFCLVALTMHSCKDLTRCTAKTTVNIRETPEGQVIGKLKTGDSVSVLEQGDDWTKIEQGGIEGYVATPYLKDCKTYSKKAVFWSCVIFIILVIIAPVYHYKKDGTLDRRFGRR
jgi:hypothetical protein